MVINAFNPRIRQKQASLYEFAASLIYKSISRPARAAQPDFVSKNKKE